MSKTSNIPRFVSDNLPGLIQGKLNHHLVNCPAFTLTSRQISELFTPPEHIDIFEQAAKIAPNRIHPVHYFILQNFALVNGEEYYINVYRNTTELWIANERNVKIREDANPEHVAMLVEYLKFRYRHAIMLGIANHISKKLVNHAASMGQLYKAWPEVCNLLRSTGDVNTTGWGKRSHNVGARLMQGADMTRARGVIGWTDEDRKIQRFITLNLQQAFLLADKDTNPVQSLIDRTGIQSVSITRKPRVTLVGGIPITPIF